MWRVEDGKQMAALEAKYVNCLAVSRDGRWIGAGTRRSCSVWDSKTYKKTISQTDRDVNGVDFSPDSTRLVSASFNSTATVWDLATGERVQTLDHVRDWVIAAKYSPQGDRIATATHEAVRVWDSNNGRLLVHTLVKVTSAPNTGLLWSNNWHLCAISGGKIKQLEASTGTVLEWKGADSNGYSCIALPQHGEFIAHSAKDIVTFWDTATHTQLGLMQHTQPINSIAVSPDDRFLAIGGQYGKVTTNSLSRITTVSILYGASLDCGAYKQLSCSGRFHIAFSPFVSCTPYSPRTRHPDRRSCAPILGVQSTRKRRSIIDCSNPRLSESKS